MQINILNNFSSGNVNKDLLEDNYRYYDLDRCRNLNE